jgi:hypothetical protein
MVVAPQATWVITWDPLPDDFVLDNEPVDNINQPAIAAALTESLELAGLLPAQALTMTNGIWQGTRENRTGYWLRWWTDQGELLPWGAEQAAQERQRAERLASQLRAAGIEPEV